MSLIDVLGTGFATAYGLTAAGTIASGLAEPSTGIVKTAVIPQMNAPVLSTVQQQAVTTARQFRMTSLLNANPTVQKNLTILRTAVQIQALKKSGLTVVPISMVTPQQAAVQPQSNYAETNALAAYNAQEQTALSGMYANLSSAMQTLQAATQQNAITKAQLAQTTSAYENLVNTPQPQPSSGTNWLQLIEIGALAVGGIIALKYLLGGKK
jgi:hypothetical protein